jgi:hypothetical protein
MNAVTGCAARAENWRPGALSRPPVLSPLDLDGRTRGHFDAVGWSIDALSDDPTDLPTLAKGFRSWKGFFSIATLQRFSACPALLTLQGL